MKLLITIYTILFLLLTTFQSEYSNKKEYYTINILGTNFYREADFNSKVLDNIDVGIKLIELKTITSDDEFEIGNGFSLDGKWIKIKLNNKFGYVFSSDLSKINPKPILDKLGTKLHLKGDLINNFSETKMIQTENGTFPKYFETKYYSNCTYNYTAWDGCFYHVFEYTNLSLNEVYHQMISEYSGYTAETNEYWIPEPKIITKKKIIFDSIGATNDLIIEIKENDTIVVSSDDCT
ncbi:hypothetical protein [Hanstruepera ponticola]|uniref:hypothetical protein n=1 Tax=Hanstruepera ponticola TaxID=2042995 RepID=UPI000CF1A4E2|nr:hypothetical protein [Hanstruepera ponticola]